MGAALRAAQGTAVPDSHLEEQPRLIPGSAEGPRVGFRKQLRCSAHRNGFARTAKGHRTRSRSPGHRLRPGAVRARQDFAVAALARRTVHGASRQALPSPAHARQLRVIFRGHHALRFRPQGTAQGKLSSYPTRKQAARSAKKQNAPKRKLRGVEKRPKGTAYRCGGFAAGGCTAGLCTGLAAGVVAAGAPPFTGYAWSYKRTMSCVTSTPVEAKRIGVFCAEVSRTTT